MFLVAILELFEDLNQNYGVHELCTRRLNQDPLENLFAIIKQQHGCNVNPSSRQFEHGMRHILITQLSKISKFTNCEIDKNNIFLKLSSLKNIASKESNFETNTETNLIPSTINFQVDYVENKCEEFNRFITYQDTYVNNFFLNTIVRYVKACCKCDEDNDF